MTESYALDHFMFATPDLAAAAAEIEWRTGVRPTPGGIHPGQGTRNMLMSLGAECYLEILGPDPSQDLRGNFGERLAQLAVPMMLMFGMRTSDIDAAYSRANGLGLWALAPNGKRIDGPTAMSRRLPAGGLLTWRLLLLGAEAYELGVPFFIQWQGAPHPSEDAAAGCALKTFLVEHSDARGLAGLYSSLSIAVAVVPRSGPPRLRLTIDTPKGEVTI